MARWSKLQKQIHNLVDPDISLKVLCTNVTGASGNGPLNRLGIFQVRLDKSVIWNFPKAFVTPDTVYPDGGDCFSVSVSHINDLIRNYLDTPKDALPEKTFDNDLFGITDILKAADRRLGRRRLLTWFSDTAGDAVTAILEKRFGKRSI